MRMSRSKWLALIGSVGALIAVPIAFAGTGPTEIKISDNKFTPANPPASSLNSGTGFHWSRIPGSSGDGRHNVYQVNGLFSSGSPTFDPINFSRNASAGTFPYICQVHANMDGTIKATPGIINIQTDQWGIEWANVGTNTGKAFDVRYRINGGDWKTWKNDTTKFKGTFGANGKPVTVKQNKTYEFEGRSEKSATKPNKHSGWSPPVSHTTVPT
jgi:plastocyanin